MCCYFGDFWGLWFLWLLLVPCLIVFIVGGCCCYRRYYVVEEPGIVITNPKDPNGVVVIPAGTVVEASDLVEVV